MKQDEWVDIALSKELPILRDRGEGQRVEFKEQYPAKGSNLSKEIAAFSSSNPGKIIIGVADDGALVGLEELGTPTGRDQLSRRIEGLCTNNVKPAITPVIRFAQEDGINVLVIDVPRGQQPIYYSDHVPYIRHLSQSRHAEPHEVIERIREWLDSSPLAPGGGISSESEEASSEGSLQSQFLSALAADLIEVLIFGEELKERDVHPWLDELRYQLGASGRALRTLATEDIAVEMKLEAPLREIADLLERVENYRLVMGGESWAKLEEYISDAVKYAQEIKAEYIDAAPLSEDSIVHIKDVIRKNARQLDDLVNRADRFVEEGRIEELQRDASEIGFALLRVSYFLIRNEDAEFVNDLRAVAKGLHVLETTRLYMDGGASMNAVLSILRDYNERLQKLILRDE